MLRFVFYICFPGHSLLSKRPQNIIENQLFRKQRSLKLSSLQKQHGLDKAEQDDNKVSAGFVCILE